VRDRANNLQANGFPGGWTATSEHAWVLLPPKGRKLVNFTITPKPLNFRQPWGPYRLYLMSGLGWYQWNGSAQAGLQAGGGVEFPLTGSIYLMSGATVHAVNGGVPADPVWVDEIDCVIVAVIRSSDPIDRAILAMTRVGDPPGCAIVAMTRVGDPPGCTIIAMIRVGDAIHRDVEAANRDGGEVNGVPRSAIRYFGRIDGRSVLSNTPTRSMTLQSRATARRRMVVRLGTFRPCSMFEAIAESMTT